MNICICPPPIDDKANVDLNIYLAAAANEPIETKNETKNANMVLEAEFVWVETKDDGPLPRDEPGRAYLVHFLVVSRDVEADTELTWHYGEAYDPIRKKEGYTAGKGCADTDLEALRRLRKDITAHLTELVAAMVANGYGKEGCEYLYLVPEEVPTEKRRPPRARSLAPMATVAAEAEQNSVPAPGTVEPLIIWHHPAPKGPEDGGAQVEQSGAEGAATSQPIAVDPSLCQVLRPHQREGVQFTFLGLRQ